MSIYSVKLEDLSGGRRTVAESRLMNSMLLDFYGELLTDKQRECYDLHYNEDLSLSEIAEQSGISRQGVWDNIRRAEAALEDIEEKTGLIRRFTENQDVLDRLAAQIKELADMTDGRANQLALHIAEDINTLRTKG